MSSDQPRQQEMPNKAAEVCARYESSDEARRLLDKNMTPQAYLNALVEGELFGDAIQFMANWLPKPEAIWWGCLCAWDVCREAPAPEIDEALDAALAWLREPTEKNRRKAHLAGDALGMGEPAGAVALGVFFSGGSISLPDLPEVEPPEGLTAKAVQVAVVAAGQQGDPAETEARQRKFLQLGFEVAQGKNRWE